MTMSSFDRMWESLRLVGRDPQTRGYRRFAWTAEDHTLREWFAGECEARGLEVVVDRAGNQWGWWGNPDETPGVVIGSHLDSVADGGAFDGPLGVVSAFAALDALQHNGFRPQLPIGVANFADEEGARFGIACAGSRLLTGALDPRRAAALRDADRTSMADAWRAAGLEPTTMGADPEALRRVTAYVELHVEQGLALALDPDGEPDLVDPARAVAIGTEIWPHGRWEIDLFGEANHAGTTRLDDRLDAMLQFAAVVASARMHAREAGCLATIGKVLARPNAVNAIADHVTCWLDARGADGDAVRGLVDAIRAEVDEDEGTVNELSWTPATPFDGALRDRIATVLPDAPLLATGAGHDAGILANAGVPTAMLFVRNPTGVSHSPAEWAEPQDCDRGVAALADVVRELAG
ncbi:MAG: allantoate amidohydrolase [Actinomycetales bacterium]|jgi:N-carbamoyl-L-amino-acid hydrolase|nr:allantoate amidohydrolase [Actinomycetales bacterium]HMT32651.1 allantoate amidohydrolase [Dermatophilaceae bacterium]